MRPSLLATALLATACVPSHRVVAEGDYYFEQCYGRDFEPRAFDREREACWESWLAHYTRHQPASRVDYALRRVEDLQAGGPQPALPGIGAPVPIDPGVESAPAPARSPWAASPPATPTAPTAPVLVPPIPTIASECAWWSARAVWRAATEELAAPYPEALGSRQSPGNPFL